MGTRSIAGTAQHSIKPLLNEIPFNFTKEIPLKMNRTKKKVAKKLQPLSILQEKSLQNFSIKKSLYNLVAFQKSREFYKRNPFKFFFQKKIIPKIFPNFSLKIDKLDIIFFKNSLQEGVF